MTMETLTRAKLARDRGFVDANGDPSARAIATLLRAASTRWGLCSRRALLKHAREELRSGDVPTEQIEPVLGRLLALGELAEVSVGHERYLVPAAPRWVAIGGGRAALIGPLPLPAGAVEVPGHSSADVVVRVDVSNEDHLAAIEAAGARQVTLEEWLHPPGYLEHVARRAGEVLRIDHWSLEKYWDLLVASLRKEGLLLGEDAELRAVVGPPGGFFGRHTATPVEGRWQVAPPDGVWCAYRRAHGEGRWLPMLVCVDGDERRALDLFDDDEWRWALLARSKALGPEEVVERVDGEQRVTWPLPAQLRAAMDLVGLPVGPWRWQVAEDAPDVWAVLR
jgi:hypothetical protein